MAELDFMKYCPLCGAENPRQQAFCLACLDGDLTTVPVEPRRKQARKAPATPVPDGVTESPPAEEDAETAKVATTLVFELVDDPAVRFLVRENQTVGRSTKADVILCGVPKQEWISGAHARFLRRGEQWYVQHIGHTNYIKVDGETFNGQEEVAVYHGSIVVLSLTAFRVNMEGS